MPIKIVSIPTTNGIFSITIIFKLKYMQGRQILKKKNEVETNVNEIEESALTYNAKTYQRETCTSSQHINFRTL